MPKIPPADDRQQEEENDDDRRDDDGTDDLAGAGEVFQKLEEEEVVPFGAGGGVGLGTIGGGAQGGAAMRAGPSALGQARQNEKTDPNPERRQEGQACKGAH